MKKWRVILAFASVLFISVSHAKDTSDMNIIYRVHGLRPDAGEEYLVDTEIHLRNNSIGKTILLKNGTFLEQYSQSSFSSFHCLYQNERCLWTKTGDWSESLVNEEDLDSLTFRMSELELPCENNNGGCQVYCSNTLTGPECSCPIPGFSLNSDNKTCTPDSENFSLHVGNEGFFKSKNYPNNYENNEEHHWLIVTSQRRRIQLNIPKLETENDVDKINVYDYSDEWLETNKWSGVQTNLSAKSSKNMMWVAFQSDHSIRNKGFEVFYTTDGQKYSTLLINGNSGTISTKLISFPRQLCLTVTYKLAPTGTINVVIKQEGENDRKFITRQTRQSNGWVISQFLSPILPDDQEETMSLSIELTKQDSKIFHIAECNPTDEADIYIYHRKIWKANDLFEPGILKQDKSGNCQNGGTFIPAHGVCECPAGFGGSTCQEACGPNRYGNNCSQECSCFQEGCRNMMFCKYLNQTSSCICASGYTGKACNKECSHGYYGVNCVSRCGQCRDGLCNIYTGKCNAGCLDGYYPPLCQERYITLTQAPKIEEISWSSIVISTNLSLYNGRGTPYLYQVQYKKKDGKIWSETQGEEMKNEPVSKNITGLQAGTQYLFRVIIISSDGNRYQGSLVPSTSSQTICKVPDSKQYQIITKNLTSVGFLLEWKYEILNNKWCSIFGYNVILQDRWITLSQNISSEGTLFVVYSNLLPAHQYNIYICALTKKGKTCSSAFEVTTKEREPGEVTNLRAVPLQGGKMKIYWNKPLITRGHITSYKLQFQCLQHLLCGEHCSASRGELNTSESEVEISNLLPLTQYKISIAAVTINEGPYVDIYAATKAEVPSIPPRSSIHPIVSKSNTSASVQWSPPICTGLNGELKGYHYILSAHSEDGNDKVVEGTSYIPQVSFSSLLPSTDYRVSIYVLNSQGWNVDYNITIPFTTAGTVPDAVEGLEIFKKGRRMVGIRWADPRRVYGVLRSFTIMHREENTEDEVSEIIDPTHCLGWSHLYCHTISGLRPEKNYSIEVKARNNEINEDGPAATTIATTREYAPDAPSYLKVLKSTSNTFDIEWGLPQKFNGELRAFIVNVEHQDSLDESDCCEYFPVQELPLREEQPTYSLQVSGLTPASRYVISVSGKTITLGPNVNTTQHTAPLPPTNLVPPKVVETAEDGLVFSVKVHPIELNSKLEGQYLVLVLPSSNVSSTNIWDEDLSDKLRSEVNGSFYIVTEINKDDLLEEQEVKIGTGKETVNGTVGEMRDPKLTPGIYQIGLALVQSYNGAKSVGFVISDLFEIPYSAV